MVVVGTTTTEERGGIMKNPPHTEDLLSTNGSGLLPPKSERFGSLARDTRCGQLFFTR
jgi:hypothetical protein